VLGDPQSPHDKFVDLQPSDSGATNGQSADSQGTNGQSAERDCAQGYRSDSMRTGRRYRGGSGRFNLALHRMTKVARILSVRSTRQHEA
jgi:hypothetical protein